ncbi:5'-nucleotidase C-terminal domain-containing protein [Agriterribacter sp.]|uniref:5'-nucleotidase C-terminal domain-containing protein n=1 Tax=Agriterribacter sp. TaxID=2821509 RepID=UPI002CB86BD2|nr:5'-nucleotidase C-terminal domain-containing protein [Agriterribacter sp.]HRO46823.1 5'-nucleotidase C-terminal domain-containing protein [Agriterribacter sp.]HRQ15568.1 5'-nucleotidase C-terminal domain-containing protein [Agriterribacter sp.]
MKKSISVPILAFIFIASCRLSYQPQSVQYTDYRISSTGNTDTSFAAFLKPYGDSVHKRMQVVVATAATTLQKKQPEGTLGNFLADALLESAAERFDIHIDAAFLNPGGIRMAYIGSGPVTIGNIYEVMPFDNLMALQEVNGKVLQAFLDLTAAKGGWPVAGLTMKIKDKKATDIIIGGKSLNVNAHYNIVNSDYIVNGGDNCDMLKAIPAKTTDYLIRDAFIDYFSKQDAQGKKIAAQIEGRVSYAQ